MNPQDSHVCTAICLTILTSHTRTTMNVGNNGYNITYNHLFNMTSFSLYYSRKFMTEYPWVCKERLFTFKCMNICATYSNPFYFNHHFIILNVMNVLL